jgi:hypothetical protein
MDRFATGQFGLVYRMLRWGHEYIDKGIQY